MFSLSSLGLGVGAIFRLGRLSCRSVFVTATADVLQGTEQRDVIAKALCQVRGKGSRVWENKANTPALDNGYANYSAITGFNRAALPTHCTKKVFSRVISGL